MSIWPRVTQLQEDQSRSRGYLDAVITMVKGECYSDKEHELVVLSRFFNNTEAAAGSTKGVGHEFFQKYADALGHQDAIEFLTEFNEVCQNYSACLKTNKEGVGLQFHPGVQESILGALEKLKEATERGSFFIPYAGMGHERRNTHLCTGR